ncbi:MAG: hypothetical protein HZA62_10785 [Rhodocyclales bacterium]|nr:hypothetical protein [Rhodocyclales bacterium]
MRRYYLHLAIVLSVLGTQNAIGAPTGIREALDSGSIGLYRADEFRVTDGDCKDCPTIRQALWYFRGDTIAVPKGKPAEFARRSGYQDDVRAWVTSNPRGDEAARPPLLWIGSPLVVDNARIDASGTTLTGPDGTKLPFAVTAKIETNLSYFDASSVRHFTDRPLRLRGRREGDRFVARTIWPDDYALSAAKLQYQPLIIGETIESLVRADGKKADAPLTARVLWQRNSQSRQDFSGKPVLAFMLNGAQGDDDEAHGGHFAVATGRFGERGEWGDWAVNNFYNLGSASEKGIIASTLPMDAYMADMNSGQSWYRPSYMLVAVLKHDRVPNLYQQAIGRVFNHFYRHDFNYRHTTANCAGINMETLRSLGWKIPEEGGDGRLKAAIALPYIALKDMSLENGQKAFDYLMTERTNLYPFAAFNSAGGDIVQRIAAGKAISGVLEGQLAEDVEALIYVRIPQFPSSRAFGQAPVASLDEYMKRVPEDRSQWKIVPAGPRNFPDELKDSDIAGDPAQPSDIALWTYGGIIGFGVLGVYRRRTNKRSRT